MDINNLIELYQFTSDVSNGDELGHLQAIKRLNDWQKKTDQEKQAYRKRYLNMLMVHFQEEDGLEYIKQVVKLTDNILSFLEKFNYNQVNVNNLSDIEMCFFRIYNMLWCEKEYIFYSEGVRATKVHIEISVFKPLIEKTNSSTKFEELNLKELFNEYKKMIKLFEQLNGK